MVNSLLNRLRAGKSAGCFWLTLGSPSIAELMLEGMPDAMVFDLQHGLWERASLEHAIGMVMDKTVPLVRVAENNAFAIGQALDAGARGVIVPLVENADQARDAVRATKYPPLGIRSGGGIRPLKDFKSYTRSANTDVLVAVMVETAEGLKNVADIASVEGVDMIFIGTGDLALSLGIYPDLGPRHEEAIATILNATRAAKKIPGIFTFHARLGQDRLAQGFQFVTMGIDSEFIAAGARSTSRIFSGEELEKDVIQGAKILVTGTSRGIGPEIVRALIEAGAAKVYCAARDIHAIEKLRGEFLGKISELTLDITDNHSIANAVSLCGDIDILINNAGVNFNKPLLAAKDSEDAYQEMTVNYFGLLEMCRQFAPVLARKRNGIIVNMLSILAHMNLPMMGSLCASKAAALSLTQALRAEMKAENIKVVGVLPGAVDTDMTKNFEGPKIPPRQVAQAIIYGLRQGWEEIYPGNMAAGVAAGLALDAKAIEQEFSRYLPG